MKNLSFKLHFEIMNFLFRHSQLTSSLHKRDLRNDLNPLETRVAFMSYDNPDNPKFAYFNVDFYYSASNTQIEQYDDVRVVVEIADAQPLQFKVLSIKYF